MIVSKRLNKEIKNFFNFIVRTKIWEFKKVGILGGMVVFRDKIVPFYYETIQCIIKEWYYGKCSCYNALKN